MNWNHVQKYFFYFLFYVITVSLHVQYMWTYDSKHATLFDVLTVLRTAVKNNRHFTVMYSVSYKLVSYTREIFKQVHKYNEI